MNSSSYGIAKYFLFVLLFIAAVQLFFFPLIISIDSILGFHGYEGTMEFNAFNFRTEVSPTDINKNIFIYQSWWSPGQWVYPAGLSYFTTLPLGYSMIVVTIISAIMGMMGYYRVFRFFNFSRDICYYSLLGIFCSYTFFYSFIVYQGGEILSFGIFPWFLYFVLSVKRPSIRNLINIGVLFFLCFLAKLTLIIYCSIIIFYKVGEFLLKDLIAKKKIRTFNLKQLLYAVPFLILFIFIYYFFLDKYPSLGVVYQFHPTAEAFLTPLSSPLTSVLSIQQIGNKMTSMGIPGLSYNVLCFFLIILLAVAGFKIFKSDNIIVSYKALLIILYTGVSLFFIISYMADRVDYSSRHFKLMGYLFLPGLLTVITSYLKPTLFRPLFLALCLIGTSFFFFIKHDWVKGRYLSHKFFYRNYDNKQNIDSVDKESYEKLLSIANRVNAPSTVFLIEANHDIVLDIPSRCIIPWKNITMKYYGHGPQIIACISRTTMTEYPHLLEEKFPGYTGFQKIDETDNCIYYQSK